MISAVILKAAVPEIGRIKAKGATSYGNPNKVNNGAIKLTNASSAPEDRSIPIETIIPTKKGSNEKAIFIPSLPPSTNNSYVGNRLYVPTIRTTNNKQGMNH